MQAERERIVKKRNNRFSQGESLGETLMFMNKASEPSKDFMEEFYKEVER